jgi:hypothetical protein
VTGQGSPGGAGPRRTLTWPLYLSEVLPELLNEARVPAGEGAAIVADVDRRGRDYLAGGRASRRALRVPFVDDVAGFDPPDAPVGCLADVAVVVRSSLLEDAHADGPVGDASLREITLLAVGAFNAWASEHLNQEENAPPSGVFRGFGERPRAYAALRALALAAENGGRRSFQLPDAPVPEPPPVPAAGGPPGGRVRRSGLAEPDEALLGSMAAVAAGALEVVFVSSLSRFSRDSTMLADAVEMLLAHGGTLLTTNFLLRPGEAFARRPPFVGAVSDDPLSVLTPDRMSGVHAKHVRSLLAQNEG